MLPATLNERSFDDDPHRYGLGASGLQPRRTIRPATNRPRDVGATGDNWRSILLDQLRQRGANFFGV